MRECPYCAEQIENDTVTCRWCGSELARPAAATAGGEPVPAARLPGPPETLVEQRDLQVNGSAPVRTTMGERQATGVLRAVAWVELALGTLGGIIVMAQASQTSGYSDAFGYSSGGSSGVLVAAGFGIIIYSVIGWAFLLVLASMATNLMVIRDNTRR